MRLLFVYNFVRHFSFDHFLSPPSTPPRSHAILFPVSLQPAAGSRCCSWTQVPTTPINFHMLQTTMSTVNDAPLPHLGWCLGLQNLSSNCFGPTISYEAAKRHRRDLNPRGIPISGARDILPALLPCSHPPPPPPTLLCECSSASSPGGRR